MSDAIIRFLIESNAIEGIFRDPTKNEIDTSIWFMSVGVVTIENLRVIQSAYAPGMPLRDKTGMNVRVGNHVAPLGGLSVAGQLGNILHRVSEGADPWSMHVEFESLHPFMDGNGRTGRILWAWNMERVMQNPFGLGFLHRFYYQTLASVDRDTSPHAGASPSIAGDRR